ncbi:MAG TPA: hypothetical protein VL993_05550 [Stellaceae bacterium]|nr:hypothetical protein [Stellaceae bacterium]
MLVEIARAAHRLDEYMSARLGRPYHALLGIGLVAEIVQRIRDFDKVTDHATILRIALALVIYCLLLLHQVGELGERRQAGRSPVH